MATLYLNHMGICSGYLCGHSLRDPNVGNCVDLSLGTGLSICYENNKFQPSEEGINTDTC